MTHYQVIAKVETVGNLKKFATNFKVVLNFLTYRRSGVAAVESPVELAAQSA